MTSDPYQPLQLKGEIMDLEFTVDMDHRSVAQCSFDISSWLMILTLYFPVSCEIGSGEGTGLHRAV